MVLSVFGNVVMHDHTAYPPSEVDALVLKTRVDNLGIRYAFVVNVSDACSQELDKNWYEDDRRCTQCKGCASAHGFCDHVQ